MIVKVTGFHDPKRLVRFPINIVSKVIVTRLAMFRPYNFRKKTAEPQGCNTDEPTVPPAAEIESNQIYCVRRLIRHDRSHPGIRARLGQIYPSQCSDRDRMIVAIAVEGQLH